MKWLTNLSMLLMLSTTVLGCGEKPIPSSPVVNAERPELTIQVRHPSNRGDAILIRLDAERLRANNLTPEEVLDGLKPSGFVDPNAPVTPPGVVFDKYYAKPEQYAEIILKANEKGEILRLKDVAKVERLVEGPMPADGEGK